MSAKRKKKRKSPIKKLVIIITALVLAFAVVFAMSSLFGAMPLPGVSARIRAYVFGDDGSEFPIKVNTVNTLAVGSYGYGFYILSDTDIKLYNESGELKLTQEHGYTSPAVSTGKYGTIVFDRSGTDYMILKRYKVSSEDVSKDGNILTAALGRNGNRAFAVRGGDATSRLYVTNKSGKELFIWNCAYEHIISVALSGNGKTAAAASIGAVEGDVVSTIHIFDFNYSEELYTHTFEGETILKIDYLSNRLLYIFTDGGIYTVKGNDELIQLKSYYPSELGFYSNSENGVSALALTKYGGSNLYELTVTGKRGKLLFSSEIEANISDVHTNGKYIFLLADKSILVYNLKGELINEIESEIRCETIIGNNRYVYLRSPDKIVREYALGEKTQKEIE